MHAFILFHLRAPHVIVERRNQDVVQLRLPVCHLLLLLQVLQRLGVNGSILHVVRFRRRDLRFEPVAVDAEPHVRVRNKPAVHARTPAIVLVSLNALQTGPRFFLSGKQRHLVV